VHRPDELPVEVFLDEYPPAMREIAIRLREIVRRELPDAEERVRLHWRLLGYHLPVGRRRTAFTAWIGPEVQHVHLGFPMGVLIDDPASALQGAGITKQARWLTYRWIDDVDEPVAVRLLGAAAGVAGLSRSAPR
jgi:hypothetical protein